MPSIRERIKPKWLVGIVLFVVVATYVEFVLGSSTVYDVAVWLLVVPLLLSSAVSEAEEHRLDRPFVAFTVAAIGAVWYVESGFGLRAVAYLLCGVLSLLNELRKRADIAA